VSDTVERSVTTWTEFANKGHQHPNGSVDTSVHAQSSLTPPSPVFGNVSRDVLYPPSSVQFSSSLGSLIF